jgi:hypothetical protein
MKNNIQEKYNFNQHRHNFAIWTSARAVQRNFTTTDNIAIAIEKSGLRDFVESYKNISKEEFNDFHEECAKKKNKSLQAQKCTYGIAAKIIAVYLKTALIVYNKGQNCGNIHPPLDRILITNFIKCNKIKEYTYKPWTQLNHKDYWELIALIEKYNSNIDWRLEQYWKIFN